MIGSFLTRVLVMVFGYTYPAYECYKTVELNKPEVEQLRFWCQYWILVALLTVFERFGDALISWLPMYSEAKLAFFIYLWYSKTKGTTYVYENFFRPYIAKHESEIDRNLLEMRVRAGDIVVLFWRRAATYGQTRFLEIMQYVASQSQLSRIRPAQQPQQVQNTPLAAPSSQPAEVLQPQPPPAISTVTQPKVETIPDPAPSPTKAHPPAGRSPREIPRPPPAKETKSPVDAASTSAGHDKNPTPPETVMDETMRVTRARLRKQAPIAPARPGH